MFFLFPYAMNRFCPTSTLWKRYLVTVVFVVVVLLSVVVVVVVVVVLPSADRTVLEVVKVPPLIENDSVTCVPIIGSRAPWDVGAATAS